MEINTTQLEALRQLQEQSAQMPRKNSAQTSDFDAILGQQLAQGVPAGIGKSAIAGNEQADVYSKILLNQGDSTSEAEDPDTAVLMAAFDQASGTLNLWDSYARTLGTSTTDTALRDAWGLLQGIDAEVAQLRDNPARAKSSALDSLLNELEIMTATEKFKFNRGDYNI